MTTLVYPDDAAIIALDGAAGMATVTVQGAAQGVTLHGHNWPTDRGTIHIRVDGQDMAVVEPPMSRWVRGLDIAGDAVIQAIVLEQPYIPKPKPPTPVAPPAHPPPPGSTFYILRGEEPEPGIQWTPLDKCRLSLVIFDPKTGAIGLRIMVPKRLGDKTALWRQLYEGLREREPNLSDEDHVIRPELTFYSMVISPEHAGCYPYDSRRALENVRGCVQRLRSLKAIPDSYNVVVQEIDPACPRPRPHLKVQARVGEW